MSTGVTVWILGWVGGRKDWGEDLCGFFRMRSERKGRLQQVLCYRAGDETRVVGSGGAEAEVWVCLQPPCCPGLLARVGGWG